MLRHSTGCLVVAADVPLIERRVHLVEEAEGRGLDEEDGEDERHRGERLLAAGQQLSCSFFPGGCATISMPVSSMSSGLVRRSWVSGARNIFGKRTLKRA